MGSHTHTHTHTISILSSHPAIQPDLSRASLLPCNDVHQRGPRTRDDARQTRRQGVVYAVRCVTCCTAHGAGRQLGHCRVASTHARHAQSASAAFDVGALSRGCWLAAFVTANQPAIQPARQPRYAGQQATRPFLHRVTTGDVLGFPRWSRSRTRSAALCVLP